MFSHEATMFGELAVTTAWSAQHTRAADVPHHASSPQHQELLTFPADMTTAIFYLRADEHTANNLSTPSKAAHPRPIHRVIQCLRIVCLCDKENPSRSG